MITHFSKKGGLFSTLGSLFPKLLNRTVLDKFTVFFCCFTILSMSVRFGIGAAIRTCQKIQCLPYAGVNSVMALFTGHIYEALSG